MLTISQEQLINIINSSDISFLLGAGCSISSGCMSANNLIYEFKKRIYCNELKQDVSKFEYLSDDLKNLLDNYFSNDDVKNPYSYYFEKCLPLKVSRMQFIKDQFLQKKPSTGYKCFAKILEAKKVKNVYTTNFDSLIEKSVRLINPDADIGKVNDKYLPITTSEIYITELHGDYNYALPKNTEEELKSLGENTKNAILQCPAQIIIVMGYSGADNSVMTALKEFVSTHKTKSIIWCVYEGNVNNEVKEFMEFANRINEDSCFCNFSGFDDLCFSYYKQYLKKDSNIESEIDKNVELKFGLNFKLDKREILGSNLFKCTAFPSIYKIHNIKYSSDLHNLINQDYIGQFYRNDLYFIGEISWLQKIINFTKYEKFSPTADFILHNKTIAIKLLKDFVKKSILTSNNDIKAVAHKMYFLNKKDADNIYDGFSIDFIGINGEIYLTILKEYVYEGEKTTAIKAKILNKFKFHRNNNSHDWLCDMTNMFGNYFELFGTKLEYDTQALMLSDLDYTLLPEPSITTNCKDKKISALQCISQYGIQKPIFEKTNIKIAILCPIEDKDELARYFKNLNVTLNSTDIIYPNYYGFEQMFGIKMDYDANCFNLSECDGLSFMQYCKFILTKLEEIKRNKNPDIIIIYTPKSLEKYEVSEDGNNNLHDYIKLYSANSYITQFISYKSISSTDSLNKKIWNLAVAIYTKTIGLPWEPILNSNNTAFVGVGYGIANDGITVGCSQLFDSKGRGLQLLLKPVSSNSRNPFMTERESYEVGKSLCNMYYNTYPVKSLNNIVIHKSTPFKDEEIKGFEKAFSHIENLDLIQLEDKPNIKAIKFFSKQKTDNYPLTRGTLIKINKNEALLWTHGKIKTPELNAGNTYVKGSMGYPSPILIRRFRGNMSLEIIANDILMLTKMDYNSADVLYSNVPVTIKYTDKVVDIIKQGKNSLHEVDFRFII